MPATLLVPPHGSERNNFDAIRLAMALLVVWSHSFALWLGTEDGEPISLLLGGVYNASNIAVLAFFAISGFLITLSWERSRSWSSYLRRRVRRIYPGYLVAVLVCSFAVAPVLLGHMPPFGSPDARGFASDLLLKNYIVGEPQGAPINGSLWSIPYEFWCYLGIMALGIAGLIRRRWILPIAAVSLIGIRIWLDLTGRRPGGGRLEPIIGYAYLWFNVAPPFLLGATAYVYRARLPRSWAILIGLVLAEIAAAHLPFVDPFRAVIARTLCPFALVYGVLFFAFSPIRLPNAEVLGGDFSYGCYLYAFPIQRVLQARWHETLSFPVYVALSIILSLAAGVASWMLVERWWLPAIRKRSERQRGALPEEAVLVAP